MTWKSAWKWVGLPRSLEHQLMLLTALCLVVSLLGYGAYTAKTQTDLARRTIAAQMSALAQNLATINAYFLTLHDVTSTEAITIQTATVPGIFSVLVTDVLGKPLSEVVNNKGKWSPRFSIEKVAVPPRFQPETRLDMAQASANTRDFLAGNADIISAWHPIATDRPLGWVRVSYRLEGFEDTARAIWAQALMVIALAIGATLLLLMVLLRQPMRALRAATQFASQLDPTTGAQIEVSTRALEVEALGHALNVVSTRLYTQNRDLSNQKFALDQHAMVTISDTRGRITYINQRFCDVTGYTPDELIGKNHRIINTGFHHTDKFKAMLRSLYAGEVWRGEVNNKRKDGSDYWVDSTIVPLVGADGKPEAFIGIRTDITAMKTLEHSMQIATARAEAANRAKSDFLANMSHEIRTPMNGVIGMTELALDTELDDEQRIYLTTAKQSADALMVILNAILDFSKIEAGKLDIEQIEFSVPEVMDQALRPIAARAEKKGLTLHTDVGDGLNLMLTGDPGRIRQILTNLCDNALKFTTVGDIWVAVKGAAQREGHVEVHFSVRDSGIGIAADQQQGIFEAFSQADTSTTRRFGGTGLGLTISARLVQLMGGRIWVESVPGLGSTFHFTVLLKA